MAFRFNLSPEALAARDQQRRDLMRLYALATPDLALELAALLAAARGERLDMTPKHLVYDSNFLWAVVPEVIRRLGLLEPTAGFRVTALNMGLQKLKPVEFRRMVGLYLRNVSWNHWGVAWRLLSNEPCNGNPVVYALDRLCPGSLADDTDWIARGIKEVANARGTPYTGVWTPAVLQQDR